MANGIIVFGANGCGKTTLGRELARVLNFKHIDVEDYYFEESIIPYSKARSKNQVIDLMNMDIEKCNSFVLSSVIGDYGEKIYSSYKLGILLSVPIQIRLQRIERRSLGKYGERVLIGGDMYEQEQEFLEFVRTRNLSAIEDWAKTLTFPILYLDGTKPINESIHVIIENYNHLIQA